MTEFGDEMPLKEKMTNIFKFSVSGAPFPTASSA